MTHDFITGLVFASIFWSVVFVLNLGWTLRRLGKLVHALKTIRAANDKLGAAIHTDLFQRDARIAALEHVLQMHGIEVHFIGASSEGETLH